MPCRPYDPVAFRMWASRGICPGIPAMQWLFQTLKARGFRVFLVTGRDEETLGSSTVANLNAAGFSGYDRLIMRYVTPIDHPDLTGEKVQFFFLFPFYYMS